MTRTFSPTRGEFGFEGACRETHLPTEQEASCNQARFSRPNVDPCRTGCPQGSAAERPQAALGLIQRLRGRESFTQLRQGGTRVRSGPLWCVMLPDPSLESAYVAFAIGRATGSAVERNKVRRRLREILRSLDMPSGLYLFGLNGSANATSFDGLRSAVEAVLARRVALRSSGS